MGNVTIKQVEAGEVTTLSDTDALEVDTGTTSLWISWASIKTLLATWLTTLTATWQNKTLTAPTIADFTNAAHDHGDADDGGIIVSASDTVAGGVELATAAETTTGTDAARAVTPDGLAGSDYGKRVVGVMVVQPGVNVSIGDGKAFFRIPSAMNGWNLVAVAMSCYTAGTTNTMDVQIRNKTDAVDMLSTKLTIDGTETDSSTATTPAVIDTTKDDVATGDIIAIDVDAVHGTPAQGLYVELIFQLP